MMPTEASELLQMYNVMDEPLKVESQAEIIYRLNIRVRKDGESLKDDLGVMIIHLCCAGSHRPHSTYVSR